MRRNGAASVARRGSGGINSKSRSGRAGAANNTDADGQPRLPGGGEQMHKRRENGAAYYRRIIFAMIIALLPALIGCQKFDPANAFHDTDKPLDYQTYAHFDSGEISKQVQNYSAYYSLNATWLHECLDDIAEYGFLVVPNNEYVVGQDIEPGKYFILGMNSDVPGSAWPSFEFTRKGQKRFYSLSDTAESAYRYIQLIDGDTIPVLSGDVMLADAKNRSPIGAREGVFLEAAYSVPNEIQPGEYFALQTSSFSAEVETDRGQVPINHFGYVKVEENDTFIQMEGCVLIPVSQKPEIYPLVINDTVYYGQGMYKIGDDIPLGIYSLHPDLFMLGANGRTEIDWELSDVFDWIGYNYSDRELNISFTAQLGRLKGKTVVRKIDQYTEYEIFKGDVTVDLNLQNDYIKLINVRLSK